MSNTAAPAMSPAAGNGDGNASRPRSQESTVRSEMAAVAAAFDYRNSAELFPTRSRKARRNPVRYKRFETAAEAIRFAIEKLPSDLLLGAYLQVEEERFNSDGIRMLYESKRYPLKRAATS